MIFISYSMKKQLIKRKAWIALTYLIIWGAISSVIGNHLLFPDPVDTVRAFVGVFSDAVSWKIAAITVGRMISGFFLGVLIGVILSILSAASPVFDEFTRPFLQMIRAVPVTSFILLAVLWMKSTNVPIMITVLMVVPIVWSGLKEGILNHDSALTEMMSVYWFSVFKRIKYYWAPYLRPALLSACENALGFAWKAVVAAEIIALPKLSIGHEMYHAKVTIETSDLFAWTLFVLLLSILMEKAFRNLLRRIPRD